MNTQPTCANCAFYHSDGHCRRFPPSQQYDRWPSMDPGRWCGEHKPAGEMEGTYDDLKARIAVALQNYRSCTGVGFGLAALLGRKVLDDLTKHLQDRL